MGFLLIKGRFHLEAGMPDGDSVRFMADDDRLFDKLFGRPVEFRVDGTVQLRYEGIDAVEKGAIQPLAGDARDQNLAFLRENDDKSPDTPQGFILARQTDLNRRPVSFVFSGTFARPDGTQVFLDARLLRSSVNYRLVLSGYAYVMYYETLFMELRRELTQAYLEAKRDRRVLHQRDATTTGVTVSSRDDLATIPAIFPKLWRRLEEYTRNQRDLSGFIKFLAEKKKDKLSTLSDGRTFISFDNVAEVNGDSVKLLYEPHDMVFRPA